MQMNQSELGHFPVICKYRMCVKEKSNFHSDI